MVSKTVMVLAIVLVLISVIAIGVMLMHSPQTATIATNQGQVSAIVIPAAPAPVTVSGKVIMNVVA